MSKSTFLPMAYFDNQYVPFENANLSVATMGLQYGLLVFGGVRGYLDESGRVNIFRARDHFTRLTRSANLLKMSPPPDTDVNGLIEIAAELTRRNAPTTDVYYRPCIYKPDLSLGPSVNGGSSAFAIYMLPLGNYFGSSDRLSLMVSSWSRVPDNAIPARGKIGGAYVNSALAKGDAQQNGYDDAIMLNHRGKVAEGSAANLFMVRDGVLITSPVTGDILEGITRRTVITLATDLGFRVEEREIDRSEVYICDELFLCGTAAQISPVGKVDGRTIGDPNIPITAQLQQRFNEAVRGKIPEYRSWLTQV